MYDVKFGGFLEYLMNTFAIVIKFAILVLN